MNTLLRYFAGKPMGFKLTVIFLSVVLLPMSLLAYISYKVVDSRLFEHAREQVSTGMKAAWTEYYIRGEQMRYGMLQAASMDEIKRAVGGGNADYLRKMMTAWKQMRPYVDLWAITDLEGKVIARVNSPLRGDKVLLNGLVAKAIETREPQVATEMLDESLVRLEGNALFEKIFPLKEKPGPEAAGIMALTVVTPVLSEKGSPVGAIITADVINNDSFVPDMVSYKLPGFFTTISSGGTRVSTNITDESGRNARGSHLQPSIQSQLSSGKSVFAEWELPGLTLISSFEPIRDSKGLLIGSLDVGISKERMWAIQSENQQVIAVVTLIAISLSLLAALISTYRITKPIKELRDKLSAFGSGEQGARIALPEEAGDEISVLARSFNRMAEEVGGRNAERGRHLEEIERKNSELAELNEQLRITNEELEVAYEETQSQTEELHAINEELKLLNEDLDRKNTELQKANRTITQEEDELKKARNKLRLIYDSIRDFILLVGEDYRIIEANRSFLEANGLSEPAAAGRNIYAAFGIEPPGRNCPIRRSIETASPTEIEFTTPDGRVLVWQSYPILEDDCAGKRSAVVYVHDTTERRLLTQKLIQADKLSSLGELVSGVAHELNNPLTGIMCFSELLMEDGLGESASSKLRKINDASHRCKKIIENLLTFARWKRPEKKYGDVNRIIRDSVDFRAYQLKIDNIRVILDLDSSLPWTMMDSNQIQQVLLNLINNASDAIKESGSPGRIRISSRHASGRIVISVEDTGRGISEEIVNRIFDPFFTTKEVGKGTGLGLSISYGIVHEHGGNIYASSRPNYGTTFVVELPVAGDSGITEAQEGALSARLKVEGKRALVLDDEAIVLDLLTDSLTGFGFEVDRCTSAEEAIRKVAASDYDIIISDIKMPGLGGIGFYREVKAIKPSALGRVIFISGDSISPDTQCFLSEIGSPSLKKPFTIDELSAMVSKVVF